MLTTLVSTHVRALSTATLVALCLFTTPAGAQFVSPDAQARELYVQGDRAYNEGRYEDAVGAFQQAYRLSGRPLLLFNLANAYERLGRYQEALDALRGYAPNAPLGEQSQIRARIASLEQRAAQPSPPPTSTPTSGASDSPLLITGIAVGGAGLALAVGGVVLGVLALDARSQAQGGCTAVDGVTVCDASVRGALSDDATFALLADIGIFAGAAAVAAGVVLAILGATSSGETQAAAVPYVAPRADGGELGVVVPF